jgi:protease-4
MNSIFSSSLRAFCKVFFCILAVFLAMVVAGLIFQLASSSPYANKPKTMLNLLPDLKGDDSLKPMAPVVLRINIHGMIGNAKEFDAKMLESILVDSRKGVLANRVKAILLHMNTPGGGVFESANMYQLLKDYKERYNVPIFAYVNGICASGGMYISSAADRTYAAPCSIVGSVGVLSSHFFNFSELMEKLGVQALTLVEGIDKDALNSFRPWKPNEDQALQPIMNYFYQTFVDVVVAAHPRLNREKLIHEYGAKIYDAPMGAKLGFIDYADVDYKSALYELMIAANIDPEKPVQIVELSAKNSLFEKLLEGSGSLLGGKVEHVIHIGAQQTRIKEPFAYLYEGKMSI